MKNFKKLEENIKEGNFKTQKRGLKKEL